MKRMKSNYCFLVKRNSIQVPFACTVVLMSFSFVISILGAGESGKSTIIKQMKLIHDGGFTKEQKELHKEIIFNNTLQSMLVILEAMNNLDIKLGNAESEAHSALVMRYQSHIDHLVMPQGLAEAIKILWSDEGVQEAFSRKNEYQLNDSAP